MLAIESLCHGIMEGTGLEVAGQHRRPGDGLEKRPMRAEGGDKRENDQNFAKPQEHEGSLVEIFIKSTTQGLDMTYRGKVSTVSTLFKINNLSVYIKPYIFGKVSTSLVINDLSVYINDNAGTDVAIKRKLT